MAGDDGRYIAPMFGQWWCALGTVCLFGVTTLGFDAAEPRVAANAAPAPPAIRADAANATITARFRVSKRSSFLIGRSLPHMKAGQPEWLL
jgi:hypothetical protein